MIQRPPGVGVFQFVILAALRAAQLTRGCRPRLEGIHKNTVMAQLEVSEGMVMELFVTPGVAGAPVAIPLVANEPR